MSRRGPFTFYEFFCGGGMARTGLGPDWTCLFANDVDAVKAQTYAANFGRDHLRVADVWDLRAGDLPGRADLAWASSPCQDLSLAGARQGLSGSRSSAFWGFWALIEALDRQDRAPRAIGIENVTGLLSSRGGADFTALCAALAERGYHFGALQIDAARFVPQSRPRLFVLAVRGPPPASFLDPSAGARMEPVRRAFDRLPPALQARWLWWRLPHGVRRNADLADLLEPDEAVAWLPAARTQRLLALMAPVHRAKLDAAKADGGRRVGALFRRMRVEAGKRVQRAEVRFDGLAGCLRTPTGGSSRQFIIVVEGQTVKARLVTGREAARLMGLPEDYLIPGRATAALHLAGDGVAAPVVRCLAAHILEPLLGPTDKAAAA